MLIEGNLFHHLHMTQLHFTIKALVSKFLRHVQDEGNSSMRIANTRRIKLLYINIFFCKNFKDTTIKNRFISSLVFCQDFVLIPNL